MKSMMLIVPMIYVLKSTQHLRGHVHKEICQLLTCVENLSRFKTCHKNRWVHKQNQAYLVMLHWTEMADGHLRLVSNGLGGLLRPVMSPGLKSPLWFTH